MITWYLWHNFILPSKDAIRGMIALSLAIGLPFAICSPGIFHECFENHKNMWMIIPAIIFAFGFPIFIPLLIDIALVVFLISIPVIIFKIVSFIVKTVGSTLERKYENYISDNSEE